MARSLLPDKTDRFDQNIAYVIIETSLKTSNESIRKSLAYKVIAKTLTLYLKVIIQEDLSDKDSHDRRASYKYSKFRNSPEEFCKKAAFKNFSKFTGKNLCGSLF